MRPFTDTVLFDDALRMALDAVVPIERTERVPLGSADGRVVAHDVTSTIDVPPFNRSAMDGYAVRSSDVAEGTKLRRVDTIYTGAMPVRGVGPGECIEISTGAPIPDGADAVVMVEETKAGLPAEAGDVLFTKPAKAGQNIGRRAADIAIGATVVRRGDVLSPSRIGALAATGHTSVEVFAMPAVALLSTGNEIVEPGSPLAPGQIYDINRFTLEAVVKRHGGVSVALPVASDDITELGAAMDTAAAHDLIVFSGGSSVGERDLLRDVVAARGEMIFHGISVKPGKPTAFARIGRALFLGMPGNPTSCLSNAYLLLVPILRKMARLRAWEPRTVTVPLARRIASPNDRHQFYSVRVVDGQAEAAFKGSGDITSMANADGYIEIAAGTAVIEAGTRVKVVLF
jgi:molybdopterin molybdotransferase